MDKLIEQHREDIIRIAAKHGAGNVRVFGSRARGDALPGSDADFLVDVVGPMTPWWPGGLVVDLKDLLGCEIDVTTPSGLHWFVKKKVLDSAVPL